MCPSPNPSGFDWLSDDDDFGRFSVIDDDKDAPTGDFGEEDAADVVGDGALAKPFPAPLVCDGGEPGKVGGVIGEEDTGIGELPDDAEASDWACAAAKLAAIAGCSPGGRKGLLNISECCCCC